MSEASKQPRPKRRYIASAIKGKPTKVNGVIVECVGLSALAVLSDKSVITLRQWEDKGWLPIPNIRGAATVNKNGTVPGPRLYTIETAKKMAELIRKAKAGIAVPADIKHGLYVLIKEERELLKSKANATPKA